MAQTSIDLDLFNIMTLQQDRNWKDEELAEETGADTVLLCESEVKAVLKISD